MSRLPLLLCLSLVACAPEPPTRAGPSAPASAAAAPVEETASGDHQAPWWAEQPRPGWAGFERVEVPEDQGWFEVRRMGPGTWAILEPGQWQEVI